jgi:hypothetical protein
MVKSSISMMPLSTSRASGLGDYSHGSGTP